MTITPVTSGTEILSFTANTHAHRSCGISKDTEVLSTKKKKKEDPPSSLQYSFETQISSHSGLNIELRK